MKEEDLLQFSQKVQAFTDQYLQLKERQHYIANFPDLTLAEVHTLVSIARNEGTSLTELAKLQEVSRSAITQMIQRLEKKGLIFREENRQFKASYQLRLTGKGREVYQIHQQQHAYLNQQLLDVLKNYPTARLEEFKALMDDLEKIWQKLP